MHAENYYGKEERSVFLSWKFSPNFEKNGRGTPTSLILLKYFLKLIFCQVKWRIPTQEYLSGGFFLKGKNEIEKLGKIAEGQQEPKRYRIVINLAFHYEIIVNQLANLFLFTFFRFKGTKNIKTGFATPWRVEGSNAARREKLKKPLHSPHAPGAVVLFHPKDLTYVNKFECTIFFLFIHSLLLF